MDKTIIYEKTDLGQLEIVSRTHRLASGVRIMLIMVDGRRSAAELELFSHDAWVMRVDLGRRARREERRVASHTSDEQRSNASQSGRQHPCIHVKTALIARSPQPMDAEAYLAVLADGGFISDSHQQLERHG